MGLGRNQALRNIWNVFWGWVYHFKGHQRNLLIVMSLLFNNFSQPEISSHLFGLWHNSWKVSLEWKYVTLVSNTLTWEYSLVWIHYGIASEGADRSLIRWPPEWWRWEDSVGAWELGHWLEMADIVNDAGRSHDWRNLIYGKKGIQETREHENRGMWAPKKNKQPLEGLCWDLLQPDLQVDTCFFLFKWRRMNKS